MTKKRCGIRENAKYLDGIRDLTPTREARFAKICTWEAGFFCLSVGNLGDRHDPNKRSSGKKRINQASPKNQSKGPIYILHLWIRDSDETVGDAGFS